jgi:hypothetical protein
VLAYGRGCLASALVLFGEIMMFVSVLLMLLLLNALDGWLGILVALARS